MMLEALAPVGAMPTIDQAGFLQASQIAAPMNMQATAQAEAPSTGFGTWFAKEINEVNDKLVGVNLEAQKVAAGSTENLQEVMIRMQDARMSFELLAQVRNRLLESYQEVMRMQV